MAKMKMRPEPHALPESIVKIADDLAVIVEKHFADHGSKATGKPRTGPKVVDWEQMIGESRPSDVEEWSWRDLAMWFSAECKKRFVPFVLRYERDIGIIKEIHSDLISVGRNAKSDVKDLISWAFENQDGVLEAEGSFTLSSIRGCVNLYLQKQPAKMIDGERYLGIDLVKEMKGEYGDNRTTGVIRKYGIPLTAALFRKLKPDYPLERIVGGIEERLRSWLKEDGLENIQDVARRSITSSPYPDWFPLLDWRRLLAPMWKESFSTSKGWWDEEDHDGRPYSEYDAFREDRDRDAQESGRSQ